MNIEGNFFRNPFVTLFDENEGTLKAHDGAFGAVDRGHFLTSTLMGTRALSFKNRKL